MLTEKISNDEIDFFFDLHDITCLSEVLFHDFDNLNIFDEELFGKVRLYQLGMQSSEYIMDENPNLSKKENFKILEGAGTIANFGARKYGKTKIALELDVIGSFILLPGWDTGFSSIDFIHIRAVMEKVLQAIENHPIASLFKKKVNRNPYLVLSKEGFNLESINMNLVSKSPGSQFFGKHIKKLWIDESSFETVEVNEKREEAISEFGCIQRLSGMTNFTKLSPAGKIFYDLKRKNWVVNYPQYINPNYDKQEEERAIKKYGSKDAPGYRVFIGGEVVESGVSVFDMSRIRPFYNEDKLLQSFSINKDTFKNYKDIVIVERPKNSELLFISADIGESASTDINIISKVGEKYKYLFAISLFNLSDIEQKEFFKWLAIELQANIIALDVTDGTGRAIYNYLETIFPKDNLIRISFNEKIPVGIEIDEKTKKPIIKDGKPIMKTEWNTDWSINQLKHLLYSNHIDMPLDYSLDMQLNSVVTIQGKQRSTFSCLAPEDHRFQSFQVFALAKWLTEFKLNLKSVVTTPCLGVSGTL